MPLQGRDSVTRTGVIEVMVVTVVSTVIMVVTDPSIPRVIPMVTAGVRVAGMTLTVVMVVGAITITTVLTLMVTPPHDRRGLRGRRHDDGRRGDGDLGPVVSTTRVMVLTGITIVTTALTSFIMVRITVIVMVTTAVLTAVLTVVDTKTVVNMEVTVTTTAIHSTTESGCSRGLRCTSSMLYVPWDRGALVLAQAAPNTPR